MTNHLLDILLALSKAEVKYVVVGGVAVVLHGVERMTLDLDLVVEMSPENMQRLIDVFHSIRLKPRVPVAPESLLDEAQLRVMREEKNMLAFAFIDLNNPFRQVDLLLTESYQDLHRTAEMIHIHTLQIPIVSKERLIDMKKKIEPLRDKDIADIAALQKKLQA